MWMTIDIEEHIPRVIPSLAVVVEDDRSLSLVYKLVIEDIYFISRNDVSLRDILKIISLEAVFSLAFLCLQTFTLIMSILIHKSKLK